jgi:hypothetical protein
MNKHDTIRGATIAAALEPKRKTRSDATPLDPHATELERWMNEDGLSYQACCDRLKERHNVDCTPKVIGNWRKRRQTLLNIEALRESLQEAADIQELGIKYRETLDAAILLSLSSQVFTILSSSTSTFEQRLEMIRLYVKLKEIELKRERYQFEEQKRAEREARRVRDLPRTVLTDRPSDPTHPASPPPAIPRAAQQTVFSAPPSSSSKAQAPLPGVEHRRPGSKPTSSSNAPLNQWIAEVLSKPPRFTGLPH